MTKASRILYVEDDIQISKSLSRHLSLSGFHVTTAETLKAAADELRNSSFDIILLDVNLPDGNGLDFCHELRSGGNESPILFLSANTAEENVVKGMNNGGDDYLRKPFGTEELMARIRRAMKRAPPPRDVLEAGPIRLDLGSRSASIRGQAVHLARREFDILANLARRPKDVVTRENLLSALGDNPDVYDRTIDSHVSHLRRKLRQVASDTVSIVPVYGVGYKLEWTS